MKPGIVPALVFFAVATVALMSARDMLAGKAVRAEAAKTVAAATTPATSDTTGYAGGRTASLRKEADGHYWTNAYINGRPVRFLVDSGASVVALTTRDALRIGLNPDTLPHNADISTAGGHIRAASVMLETVKIDRVEVGHVQAVIIDKGLDQSLLGMSFLNALKGWTVTPEAIVIRQ